MNMFDFAMAMERDGERYYRELAAQVQDEGLRLILETLADDEVKHYEIFREMKASAPVAMADTEVLARARNVFVQISEAKEQHFDLAAGQVEMYRKAQEIEQKSIDFYQSKVKELPEGPTRELLRRIVEEERKHYTLLGHIIDFVERPLQWLEDAEFNHLDDY